MRYVRTTLDIVAGLLLVAGCYLIATWLALMVAGVLLALVSLTLDAKDDS